MTERKKTFQSTVVVCVDIHSVSMILVSFFTYFSFLSVFLSFIIPKLDLNSDQVLASDAIQLLTPSITFLYNRNFVSLLNKMVQSCFLRSAQF